MDVFLTFKLIYRIGIYLICLRDKANTKKRAPLIWGVLSIAILKLDRL